MDVGCGVGVNVGCGVGVDVGWGVGVNVGWGVGVNVGCGVGVDVGCGVGVDVGGVVGVKVGSSPPQADTTAMAPTTPMSSAETANLENRDFTVANYIPAPPIRHYNGPI